MNLLDKLAKGIKELNQACLEREDEINGLVIGLLTGVNVLLLGPPGVGKSYLVNMFSKMFGQGEVFSWLLTKTSTPEELFGPISMRGLKEDKYEHNIFGKLPTKKVAFLDEIWKANSAILNSLLTIANEKVFYNGTQAIQTPLEIIIGASNEYPKDKALDALYDRFGLRFWVEPLKQQNNLMALISMKRSRSVPVPSVTFTAEEISELRKMMQSIIFNDTDTEILYNIKHKLTVEGFVVSDRTIAQTCPDLVCASALVHGHTRVTGQDWQVLADSLWYRHDQRDVISVHIGEVSDPMGQKLQAIKDTLLETMRNLPSVKQVKTGIISATQYVADHIMPTSIQLQQFRLDLESMEVTDMVKELTSLINDSEKTCQDLSYQVVKLGATRSA